MPDIVVFGFDVVAQHAGAIAAMSWAVEEANAADLPVDDRLALAVSLLRQAGLTVAVRRPRPMGSTRVELDAG